jgi:hypothetical protein
MNNNFGTCENLGFNLIASSRSGNAERDLPMAIKTVALLKYVKKFEESPSRM